MRIIRKYTATILAGLICAFVIILTCMTIADLAYTTNSRVEAKTPTEATREADKGIEETPEESTVQIIEIKNEETVVPEVKYFDCPLSEEVQDYIFAECKRYGISPAVVIAIIEKESTFDRYAMGDNGRSFGLMQIQVKSHIDRMIDLDCTDIFDPIKNVTVGINYLAELQNRYGDITKALVAYNAGCYNGTITSYAYDVLARAERLGAR